MHTNRLRLLACSGFLAFFIITLAAPSAWPQAVSDRVRLVERAIGVPGHPTPGNPGVSHRFLGGTTVTVTALDAATGWVQVEDSTGASAWITRTYIAEVVLAGPAPSGLCYRVGTWNLEHFHTGASRGFPENTHGGPTYPSRTLNDLTAIAAAIRETLGAKVLILNEIMGEERTVDGEIRSRSAELDALVAQETYPHYYPLILCAARTGMREGELIALQWGDVDLRRRLIQVRRTYYRGRLTSPKSGAIREVLSKCVQIEVRRQPPRLVPGRALR